MGDLPLHIRPLATLDEFRMVEGVQRQAWGIDDPTQVVPVHVLLTAQKEGGLVAGAFDEQGQMVGYVFGFIGLTGGGKFKHCSHMAGVIPAARGADVGYRLKMFQRQYVQKQGFDLVTWTYDPLEGRNARLNIAKLGGIARKYYHNLYGDWEDGINKGLPTDRFEVEWWINSDRVESITSSPRSRSPIQAIRDSGAVTVISVSFDAAGLPQPESFTSAFSPETTLLVEVPSDFQAVKAASMALAEEWRRITALTFTRLFGEGYIVYDFLSEGAGGDQTGRRNFYLLATQVPGLPL